jgi:hypothetical protein
MDPKPQYWFPAKRFGWGWGPPCAWQGWVALLLWAVLLVAGLLRLQTQGRAITFGFVAFMTLVFIGLCWLTGEPPRWRGRDSE